MLTRPLLICALVFSSGCSLALVKGPPDFIPAQEQVPMGSCSIERILPVLDAVGAGAFAVTTHTSSDGNAVRVSAVLGAALGFSSYTGFRRVENCKERMFLGLRGPFLDTALVQPLDGISPPLFVGPLLPDPMFTRFSPDRSLPESGKWPKRD